MVIIIVLCLAIILGVVLSPYILTILSITYWVVLAVAGLAAWKLWIDSK